MKSKGRVVLVGAGPGNPGLLTLRALWELEQADTVVYDRLVGEEILSLIPEQAERIDVGKESGHHPVPQEEINALLLEKARQGKRVVRLKGGDPCLFGRAGEELERIAAEGIPFAVIPGVTSALAAPAWAGIPVTHRDCASSVHIVTGHGRDGSAPDIDFAALAKLDGTLVFLMGVSALESICGGLVRAGMDPATTAALVQNGTLPGQRKLLGGLAELPVRAKEAGITPPAVLVVGKVCGLSDTLDWASAQPLWGRTVLVTRPAAGRCRLAEGLEILGCQVLRFPAIRLEPLDVPLPDNLRDYGWLVFTSAYGAELFFRRLRENRMDIRALARTRFAAIGARTARVMEDKGILVDFVPNIYDAAHLARGLVGRIQPDERALLYRAKAGTRELPDILGAAGIAFDDLAAYDTLYAASSADRFRDKLQKDEVDLIAFTSASTVEGFVRAMGKDFDAAEHTALCIGEQTARRAGEYGFAVAVSRNATFESMAERTVEYFQSGRQ